MMKAILIILLLTYCFFILDRKRVFSAREPIKDSTNDFLTVSCKELGTDIEIMIYEDQWLKRNYLAPLKRMSEKIFFYSFNI